MQVNFDSATLARQEIALAAPTRTDRAKSKGALVFSGSTRVMMRMRTEIERGEAWEDMVWVLISLCSLAVLVLSLV